MKKKERQRIKKANKLLVSALVAGALFSAPAMAENVYTVVDGTSVDYSYITTDGVTPLYKSIIINTTGMKTSSKIGWEKSGSSVVPTSWDGTKATGTIKVTMPHNGATQDEYYTYTYTKLGTYTTTDTRILDITADNTDKKVFVNIDTSPSGGAIYNNADKSLINILSDFIMNKSTGSSGGAIYNGGKIGTITGDFIGNTATDSGGAIYNGGKIGTITGDFIGNTATNYHGGAIFNTGGAITSITGDFIGNTANQDGGAIYNGYNSTIDSITGDFIGNTATDSGGAIYNYNYGKIGTITGDFIGNTATNYHGGAIFNGYNATIDSITGDFIGNTGSYVGAIYNDDGGTIGTITGDFIGNTGSYVGAIINVGTIGTITGDFIGNTGSYVGAIYNEGTISNIEGDFINNSSISDNGGAIANTGTISSIAGNFTSNSADGYSGAGGAIYNYAESSNTNVGNITGNFTSNSANGLSGAGGAIYNYAYGHNANIGNILGDFTSNSVGDDGSGGAIYNFATLSSTGGIGNITGDFTSNSAGHTGGAICNYARGGGQATLSILATNNKDVTFNGNYMTSASGKGGAIYNHSEDATAIIGLYADTNRTITFVGGADEAGKYDIDGIYNTGTLNINGHANAGGDPTVYAGTVILNKVSGNGTTKIYGGNVVAKDTIEQTAVTVQGTLNLGKGGNITYLTANLGSALSLSVPTSVVANYENTIDTLNVGSLMLAWDTEDHPNVQLTVDYDATAAEGSNMDKIIVNNASNSYGKIKLANVNVINDGVATNVATFLKEATSGALGEITDNTTTISTTTSGGYKYTFTPSSKGVVTVTRTATGETLAQAIQNPTGASSFSITTNPYTTNENLGSLAGDGRNFTIFGNGNAIDGNEYEGITVNNGQIFALKNADMKNFKKETGSKNGGAIENKGTITSITGNFSENEATTDGGAIYNSGTIGNTADGTGGITGNFNDNTAKSGAAIWNESGTITNIKGNFTSNISTNGYGAIYNKTGAIIGNADGTGGIVGDFNENTGTNGGAIANAGTITNIKGNFTNNSATSMGGAIVNTNTINKVTGNFTNNSATNGGAIYNARTINFVAENGKNITFSGNYVTTGNGGAIFNATTGTVGLYASADHSITFTGDTTGLPSTAKNVDSIHNINILNINGNGTDTYKGTVNLYNVTDAATARGTTNIYGGTVNANANIKQDIINVKSGATLASNTAGVEIKADGTNGNLINDGTINITGANSRFGADHLTNNATINITGANSLLETSTLTNNGTIDTVSLLSNSLNNNGNITTSGAIEALIQNNEGGSITFNGDAKKLMELTNSGTVNFNGGLSETGSIIRLTQNDGVMNFSTNAIESTTNLPINIFSMNGGSVNIADGSVNTLHIRQLNLTGNTNFAMDADLAAGSMDKIQIHDIAGSTITEGKVININKINLLSDATQEKINLSIFADDATKNALKNNVYSNINGLQYSPIYKYDALYNPETGMIGFTRYKNGGYDDLNPAVMAGAVAAQVGGYLNQLNSYDNAFEHMDSYMNLTRSQRTAMKMLNRYASAGANLPTYNPNQLADESRGIWFKPYATFEKVNLKGGPNVENTAYGSFVGGDSDLIELKNGWDVMYSAYASYDGSHQNYDGVSVYQNGGHLGGTATWYKGNFFTGLTANVGASVAEASTMYGTDNMTMLMAGVASKTGYNWELLNSKLIVQPSMLMSYSFVNMFDYTNKAGVAIDSDPLHAIQIAPGLKFIGNLPHGWQPYIGVQMVWNIMDETKFSAANVNLPQLSTRPYFQYGIGVQKKWGDRFSGYLQAMLRNGGRTGIALSAGFRWALGKDVTNGNLKQTNNSVPELPKTKIILSSASK